MIGATLILLILAVAGLTVYCTHLHKRVRDMEDTEDMRHQNVFYVLVYMELCRHEREQCAAGGAMRHYSPPVMWPAIEREVIQRQSSFD